MLKDILYNVIRKYLFYCIWIIFSLMFFFVMLVSCYQQLSCAMGYALLQTNLLGIKKKKSSL